MTDSASSSNPSNTAGTTGNSRTYPTDPFERDFRSPAANMSAEEILKFMEPDFQDLTEDDIRTLQSKEWAERMRPWCQWHTILKVSCLLSSPIS